MICRLITWCTAASVYLPGMHLNLSNRKRGAAWHRVCVCVCVYNGTYKSACSCTRTALKQSVARAIEQAYRNKNA